MKKLIWKFIDTIPNLVIQFLNSFTKHGKIIANYVKSIEISSKLLCRTLSRVIIKEFGWLVGCIGFNGPLRQYFSLYRAVSPERGRKERKDRGE